MDCKIRIKLGDVEIEYEGSEDYVREGFMDLVAEVVDTFSEIDPPSLSNDQQSEQSTVQNGEGNPEAGSAGFDMSTSTIASKIGGSTGADLVLAAAAHLSLARSKGSFSRNEIREEMKGATAYYTKSIGSNLGQSLTSLVKKGTLNQRSDNTYALPSGTLTNLKSQLAT